VIHPREALSVTDIETVVAAVRGARDLPNTHRFNFITLHDSGKAPDAPRQALASIVDRASGVVSEAVVGLPDAEVISFLDIPDAVPPLLYEEAFLASITTYEDERWREAMRKRGITDFDSVQLDPWPPGWFGEPEDDRRLTRVLSYRRDFAEDNGYAHPVEGVVVWVDLEQNEVVRFEDHGVVPVPPDAANYRPEDVDLRADRAPLEIVQPNGPGFVVDGNRLSWQRWDMRITLHAVTGLTLHDVGYDDPAAGRRRSIAHQLGLSEMVVPYGDIAAAHNWKNAFDCGEWGLGRMTNSLSLGCDCLGVIHYLDAALVGEQGEPQMIENAICIHEEDYGILWKHLDMHTGTVEVRRRRRLVVSAIHTVGNYEYGFYWYFHEDGTIAHEVKLTGIVQVKAIEPGTPDPYSNPIGIGLAAPHHQHLFCFRLDLDIDGTDNIVEEVEVATTPAGPDNPRSNGFVSEATRFESEHDAMRLIDSGRARRWRVSNPGVRNGIGQPVAYELHPQSTPVLHALDSSSIASRARFATKNLWVTPYDPAEHRCAGDYPTQHPGEAGLPTWTSDNRSLGGADGGDVVLWHTFGVTHLVRPEDWPVMPTEVKGFSLVPVGFFDRNPALDVAPQPGHHG
jgi:primary-amine oxidase